MKGQGKLLLILAGAAAVVTIGLFITMGGQFGLEPTTTSEDRKIEQITSQGTSDETTSIETDLEATEFIGLDTELDDINRELSTQ